MHAQANLLSTLLISFQANLTAWRGHSDVISCTSGLSLHSHSYSYPPHLPSWPHCAYRLGSNHTWPSSLLFLPPLLHEMVVVVKMASLFSLSVGFAKRKMTAPSGEPVTSPLGFAFRSDDVINTQSKHDACLSRFLSSLLFSLLLLLPCMYH